MNLLYDLKNKKMVYQKNNKLVKFLYNNSFGRLILKLIINPIFSKGFSLLIKCPLSKYFINTFIKNNGINMDEYVNKKYRSFDEFFVRRIKPGMREISNNSDDFIAPADAKLSVYKIDKDLKFKVKNSIYSVESILKDKDLALEYQGGLCLIYRLCVDDYHRYIYFDDGKFLNSYEIDGVLHTVNPIANNNFKVYSENNRVVSLLKTKNFDDVVYIEVGALNIGKINNYQVKEFKRGEEKGYFSFGGSTILVLIKKDVVTVDKVFLDNTKKDIETIVKQGYVVGKKNKS